MLSKVPTGLGAIVFGPALEAALKRFQRMHHLTETGAVGPATLAALNVTADAKAEALRQALAAYRRAVPPWESTFVLVQMPAAYLEYYVDGELRRHQRTALGRTVRDADGAQPMATPVLNSTITAVIFNPEWHVPWSIATNELEQAIEKDPGYLARNHYRREILGEERVRYIQSPGSHNALGRVKFHFANSHDVYLHDTPQKRLFRLPRRLLSHGCVRVEDAVKVATLMLNLDQGFNWERLGRVLKSGETTEYRLKTPIPVHLLYSTAAADSNGNLHFMPDVYAP
jgi:murein L,D-transpeptidase YcbB/YkuD